MGIATLAPMRAHLAAQADHFPDAPKGPVVLTVTGLRDDAGQPTSAQLDMNALQSLPQTQFETHTMWTDGMQRFQGVELKVLLDSLHVTQGNLIATAINDYRIEIPIDEIESGGPMIAHTRNGSPMPVRDKGPLWLVYPYDQNPKYSTEVIFSRSIWQLNRLEIAPSSPNG